MGLRIRLLLLLVVPMCVAIGGYGVVRLRQEESQLLDEERSRMEVMAAAIQVAVENALRDRQIDDIRRLLAEIVFFQGEIDRIRIFDATLKPILVSNPIQIGEEVPQQALREAMADKHTVQFFQERGGQRVLFTLVPLRGPRRTVRGVMEILRSAGDIDARVAAARREILLRVGMLVTIMAVLTWVGVRQTVVVP